MNTLHRPLREVRMEIVTSTFVAAGSPAGMPDLGRVIESLNNPAIARHVELHDATVRPLYRSGLPLQLDAPILVRRDEIIFANFEGPHFTQGAIRPPEVEVGALLLAPPFQIQGEVTMSPDADATPALRESLRTFFIVRRAQVFDAEGNVLGEGEQIIVNGGAVVMTSVTRRHIPAMDAAAVRRAPDVTPIESGEPEEERSFRAA